MAATRGLVTWVVPVEVDGKTFQFLLDANQGITTFSRKSNISKALDASVSHAFRVKGAALETVTVAEERSPDRPGCDGRLGLDVLHGCALGFDYEKSELTVWPGGVPENDAKAWVVQGKLRRGAKAPAKAWKLDLAPDPYGLLCATTGTSRMPHVMRIETAATAIYVPKSSLGNTESFVLQQFSKGIQGNIGKVDNFGSLGPWWIFLSSESPLDGRPADGGYMGINFFNSCRIILDYKNRELYGQTIDADSRSAMAFSMNFFFPIHIKDKKLLIGPLKEEPYSRLAKSSLRDGDEVVSFRGISAKKILAALTKQGPSALKAQYKLMMELHGKPSVLKVRHQGRVVQVDLGGIPKP